MMRNWKMAGSIAALIVTGVVTLAQPGNAQKKKDQVEAVVGFVDLSVVTDQIKTTPAWNVLVKKATDEQAKYKDEFAGLLKTRYLTEPERTSLQNLRAKPKLSDAEKAQADALEKKSDDLDKEYNMLAQVEKPSDEQNKRREALTKLREDALASLQEQKDRRQQSLDKMQADMLEEMQSRILKVVEGVAKDRNIVMVVDRQAILFGGQDLTQDVVKRLPK